MLDLINTKSHLVKIFMGIWLFIILSAVFVSPSYIASRESLKRIDNERAGLQSASVLVGMLFNLTELQQILSHEFPDEDTLQKAQAVLDHLIEDVSAHRYFSETWPPNEAVSLRVRMEDDLHVIRKDPGLRHQSRIRGLISHTRTAIIAVANNSGLVLDPYLDTYYLTDATVISLPEIINLLSETEVLLNKVSGQSEDQSQKDSFSLYMAGQSLEREIVGRLSYSVDIYSKEKRKLYKSGYIAPTQAQILTNEFIDRVRPEVEKITTRSAQYGDFTLLRKRAYDLQQKLSEDLLEALSEKRQKAGRELQRGFLQSAIIALICVWAVILVLKARGDSARLRDQSLLIEQILDTAGIAVWEKNLATGEFWTSGHFKRMIGYEDDPLSNKEIIFEAILSAQDLDDLKSLGLRARAGEDILTDVIWSLRRKDGQIIKVGSRIACRSASKERRGCIVGILTAGKS